MNSALTRSLRLLLLVCCSMFLLVGCATTGHHPDDPLERYNRAMYVFNDGVDTMVVRPVAKGYETVTPRLLRAGVGNFFGNLGDVWIGFNSMLQGKVGDAFSDWMRFMVNTTFGIAGVFDVASEMGLAKNDEDFGQTLAVWGVGEGPFVVLPLLGPRTLRDAVALPVDWQGDPVASIDHARTRASFSGLRIVHGRASLLGIDKTFAEALDPYALTRDSYLQQRRFKVYDGNPPIEYEDFDVDSGASVVPARGASDALVEAALDSLQMVSLLESDAGTSAFVVR